MRKSYNVLSELSVTELLTELRESEEHVNEIQSAIRRKMYAEGFEEGHKAGRNEATEVSTKYSQEQRDEIIEQAMADIEGLRNELWEAYIVNADYQSFLCTVEFIINKNKRTVVAIMKGVDSGKVYARGIAKCSPDDCFNVHIGKAIALRRALGEDVPHEYINAPQPTEVRVGDVVRNKLRNGYVLNMTVELPKYAEPERGKSHANGKFFRTGKINDDSRDEE